MSYFKLELLNLAESPIDILSSAADSQRVYYLANTISEFYSPAQKDNGNYSVKSQTNTYCYSYDESLSLHTNGQKELTFKLNDQIIYQDQLIRNPFTISIVVGSQLLLTDKNHGQYLFTVKSINTSFEKNNLIYEYSCQDSFSYQLSRQNSGYTINNDSSSETFIGAKSVDWWIEKICKECNIHYVYLPLQLGLYQDKAGAIHTYSAPVKDLDVIIKPYYKQIDYPDFFTQFPFSISGSTANAAIIAAAETVGLQVQTYEKVYSDADDHLYILRYFWLKPLKDNVRGITGCKYSPNRDAQDFSLSFSGDNLSSILNIQSRTRDNKELVSLLPTVSPFFASLFGTAYWKNSKYSAGRFSTLCHGFYLTASYQKNKEGKLVCSPGATDILSDYFMFDSNQLVFDTKSATLLDIWQLYDKVNFNQGGLYCILTTSQGKQYKSNWDRWRWLLLRKVHKGGSLFEWDLLQTLTEQDDIPWYRLNSADDTTEYRFGIMIDGWNYHDDPLESLELHIYVGRTASSSDLEFAQIADKCPWLENKLRSFDYFQKIGLISKSQLKKVNNIISNDLRKVNGELLLYANDYYQALHKRTETVANLLAQFDSLGAAAESDIITPYSTDGKITFPTNYFDAAYGSIFTPTFNKTSKTQLTAYDDLITNYSNLYFNAQQRFLKNLYQFRNYFNSPTTRYSGKNQNSFGLVHVNRSASEPPLTNGETANWIRFKTGTTFSPATADNVSWDNNETPQQIWYSAGDSSGNHSTLTVVDKSNVGKYYQLSDKQLGKQQITSTDNVVYSKDNLYWGFVEYEPGGNDGKDDDKLCLKDNKVNLLPSNAKPTPNTNNYIERIDLQLRPQLDKKRHTVSLGDLWNLKHIDEIYQRDTINIYSPISIITSNRKSALADNCSEAIWNWEKPEDNYFYKYFSFKIFKGYDKLNGIGALEDKLAGRTTPVPNDWIDAYFNNLPISNLYYQVINKDGSKTYKPLSWLNADTYKNYYKYVKNDNAVIGESIAAGYTTAGAAVAATAMAVPVVGWIAMGSLLIAGITLACVAGLANDSFLDTTGVCHIDLDKQTLTDSDKEYVPHKFQNCFPCITDKTKITNRKTKDNNGKLPIYTYEDQLQYLPRNFINYISITDNSDLSNGDIRAACKVASGIPTTNPDETDNCKVYFKDSWAERLDAYARVNTTDTYYLLPLCSSISDSESDITDTTNGFTKNKIIVGTSNLLAAHWLPLSFDNFKNIPFFNQAVVSTVLNYPIFNQAIEVHFSKEGILGDLLAEDYNSNQFWYNEKINAFCGVKTLSGIDSNTGETRYLKLTNGVVITAPQEQAASLAQVFVVYRKRDYVPIKVAAGETYWDAFKSGYSFYSTIDGSQINYSTQPDLSVGCYRQGTRADDNSITAEWDDKGATAYWEKIIDDNNKVSYRPIYTARQLLHYKDALAAPIRALVKTGTSYEQTVLFDDGARLHIPIVYCSLTKATDSDAITQKLLPQQDTLDLEVSNIGGKYYLYEVGKPKPTEENNNLVLTVSRTINDQTYTATFDIEWDDTDSNYLQAIGQMTNGAFWLKYHTLPTNADEAAALQPLFDYAAAIETQLESYWTVAYAASKYCDYFLPEHWQPYTEKEANYFSDKIIAQMGNNAVISDLYVPNISVCEHAEQKDYSLTYYSNPDDRKNPSTDNEDISKWIIDDGETSGGIADMSTIVNNNEAYSNRRDFINTVSNGGSNYFYDHYTINQIAIDKQKKYYYATSGGCRWSELVNRLSGRKDLSYDNFSGIYPRLINVLLRQYQNNPCYTYTRLKQQHDLIWQRLYQNYPNLMLENTYSNNDATTSLELYQFAKQYFNKYCQPERNYNISTIDVAQLRGYEGDATVLHVGDAIELDPNEYVDTKAADDPVYSALNQYLFISDISYKLRSDADIQLTVNDIKYEDKLIKSLATLIR